MNYLKKYMAFYIALTAWVLLISILLWVMFGTRRDGKQDVVIKPPSSGTTYNTGGIDETIREAGNAVDRSDSIIRYWRSSKFQGTEGGGKQE